MKSSVPKLKKSVRLWAVVDSACEQRKCRSPFGPLFYETRQEARNCTLTGQRVVEVEVRIIKRALNNSSEVRE